MNILGALIELSIAFDFDPNVGPNEAQRALIQERLDRLRAKNMLRTALVENALETLYRLKQTHGSNKHAAELIDINIKMALEEQSNNANQAALHDSVQEMFNDMIKPKEAKSSADDEQGGTASNAEAVPTEQHEPDV